jgi:hypothetical protein
LKLGRRNEPGFGGVAEIACDQPGRLDHDRRRDEHLVTMRDEHLDRPCVPAVGPIRDSEQDPGINDDHDASRRCSAKTSSWCSAKSTRPAPIPTKLNSGITAI